MTAGRDAPRRAIDDPAVLSDVAAIFRRARARRLQASRSTTPPVSSGTPGTPIPPRGVPGTFPTNADDPQVASAGLGNPINA